MNQQVAIMLDSHYDASFLGADFSDDQYDDLFPESDSPERNQSFDMEIDDWVRRSLASTDFGDL